MKVEVGTRFLLKTEGWSVPRGTVLFVTNIDTGGNAYVSKDDVCGKALGLLYAKNVQKYLDDGTLVILPETEEAPSEVAVAETTVAPSLSEEEAEHRKMMKFFFGC